MSGDELDDIDARDARDRDSDSLIVEDIDAFDEDGDDEDDFDDDDDDDDFEDDPEDATVEDIDLVVAAYREDGEAVVMPLAMELANDLDEMITQLGRLPGDTGAIGAVSIAGEFFVLVRVRGRQVEVLLSDSYAATTWTIARDVADFLGQEPPEDEDDDFEAMGDVHIFADLGISELDMEQLMDSDDDSDQLVAEVFDKIKFGPQFKRALAAQA